MKLRIAGIDRSGDLGVELTRAALGRPDNGLSSDIADEADVLALGRASDVSDYLSRHVRVLRSRNQPDPEKFTVPAGSGALAGLMALIRRVLWKLTRWQTDRMAFRQNAVNVQLSWEIEFEKALRERRIADLERRMECLESAARHGAKED